MKRNLDEGGIPHQDYNNSTNNLPIGKVTYFNNHIAITFNLTNKGKKAN
jgi:hypothetical protein